MRRSLITIVGSTALLLTACSSDGGGGTSPSPSPDATTVEVGATEYSFDVPAEVAGGVVRMRFSNTGGLPHEFAFARAHVGHGDGQELGAHRRGRRPGGLRCRIGHAGRIDPPPLHAPTPVR